MPCAHLLTYLNHGTSALVIALALCVAPLEARDKTDVVQLKNGDRLTGEIKKLSRGKLKLKTDALGTVSIEWNEITLVKSEYLFEIEDEHGGRYFGMIQPTEEPGTMEVEELSGKATVKHARVIEMTPLEATFWQRLDGSANLGFDFTQANNSIQWTLNADVKYRVETTKSSWT